MKFSQTDPLGKSFEHEAHLGMDARAGIGMNKGHVYGLRIASTVGCVCEFGNEADRRACGADHPSAPSGPRRRSPGRRELRASVGALAADRLRRYRARPLRRLRRWLWHDSNLVWQLLGKRVARRGPALH